MGQQGTAQGLQVGAPMTPSSQPMMQSQPGGMMNPMVSTIGGPAPQTPSAGGGSPQWQAYMSYLSQALPSINNGLAAGTIQPGQQLQNFQGPQAFGLPQGYGGGTSQPMMSGLGTGGHK